MLKISAESVEIRQGRTTQPHPSSILLQTSTEIGTKKALTGDANTARWL